MSKLNSPPQVQRDYDPGNMISILSQIDTQVNKLAEGKLDGRHYTTTSTPSSSAIPAAVGDIVWNSNVSVLGGGGSQYVILGWVCRTAGTPGTWVDIRTLTGT